MDSKKGRRTKTKEYKICYRKSDTDKLRDKITRKYCSKKKNNKKSLRGRNGQFDSSSTEVFFPEKIEDIRRRGIE